MLLKSATISVGSRLEGLVLCFCHFLDVLCLFRIEVQMVYGDFCTLFYTQNVAVHLTIIKFEILL